VDTLRAGPQCRLKNGTARSWRFGRQRLHGDAPTLIQVAQLRDPLAMEALLKQYFYGWHGPILVNQGFASHVGWALAFPLLGFWLFRQRGLLIVSAAWVLYAFFRELIEEPLEATTVSDLISRIVPVAIVVGVQLLWRNRAARAGTADGPSSSA
jgi:hypothetical protein